MKLKRIFTLILILLITTGCDSLSKNKTIGEILNGTSEKVNLNARVKYSNGSYIVFEDSTGIIVLNKNGKYLPSETGEYYNIKGKIVTEDNIKQIQEVEELTKIEAFEIESYPISKINTTYANNNLQDEIKSDYIEIEGYVEYENDTYIINNKYCNIKAFTTNTFNFSTIHSYYQMYVKVKGYTIGYDKETKMLNIIMESIEESFDMGDTEDSMDLHILEVNDVHGYCLQDENGKNGISNLTYLINQIRNEDTKDNTILIANGDMFQGTALSNITFGEAMIEIMNAMKVDVMTVGNHEFDWGLDTILKYFDGDESNGEANFPLLNANIYTSDDKLVTIENGKIYQSYVIEKEGIKVGIIGYIGDVYSSISYNLAKEYYFNNNIQEDVLNIGGKLKENGCDVIVVAIHGGNSSSIEAYSNNRYLAELKYNGKYLVDAVINGHTHTKQTGYINRSNGLKMPVVQAGCNAAAIGDIVLKIDLKTKEIKTTLVNLHEVYEADKNYDKSVEEVIQKAKKENENVLSEVYAVAGETIENQYDLIPWVSNVLVQGTGADVAICNTGGLRSNGQITAGSNVTIENMYMINPFDNYLMKVTVNGTYLRQFLGSGSIFYGLKDGLTLNSIKADEEYVVVVIDYVYYGGSFPQNDTVINTGIIMRDLLIEDIKLHNVFAPVSNPQAKVKSE